MSPCNACIKHCLRSIIGDYTYLTPMSRSAFASNLTRKPARRSYATSYEKSQAGRDRYAVHDGPSGSNLKSATRSERNGSRQAWLDSRGVRPVIRTQSKTNREDADRTVSMHLTYLKDPLKLAEFVRKTLRSDNFDLAEKLVREASRNIQCTVSWNHLIDWQLGKGKMNAAIKTYNEVFRLSFLPQTVSNHTSR